MVNNIRRAFLCLYRIASKLHPWKVGNKIKSFYQNLINARINRLWHDQLYILSQEVHFNKDFLEKNIHIQEIEHQVGRYLNMQSICNEIIDNGYSGDIIEFGTWQGLSLIFFGRLFDRDHKKRKLIGIDSFEGLPISSTIWKKGSFNNTSVDLVLMNIRKSFPNGSKHNIELIKGWYSDIIVKQQLGKLSDDIILVHFDADLGSSTRDALNIVAPYLMNRQKPIYFLFDDWGVHPDEVPDAFFTWLESFQTIVRVKAKKLFSTRYTRYYRLDFVS